MYELYPYFTNDGTVGLFSHQEDDIYHSTYGALTESWQKFTLPSHLEEYLASHDDVKILDICYGIGYNSKTALNVFINQFIKNNFKNSGGNLKEVLKNSKKNSAIENKYPEAIYTYNIHDAKKELNEALMSISEVQEHKDNVAEAPSDSDVALYDSMENNFSASTVEEKDLNLLNEFYKKFIKNNFSKKSSKKISKNSSTKNNNIEAIDTDNILSGSGYIKPHEHAESSIKRNFNYCRNILIDAVDLDQNLMFISPFIRTESEFNFFTGEKIEPQLNSSLKYLQMSNMKNINSTLKNEFKLHNEVSMILLYKLFESNPEYFNDKMLQTILSQKKYLPFLSKFMLNFAGFFKKKGYNYNKNLNKSTFLHNIYYRYISKSYKNVKKLFQNAKFDINFFKDDARNFIQSTINKYNFIFLDAFTPTKCPALWSLQFFRELYNKLEDDGMILTYSSSASIRSALLQNGFYVGKTFDPGLKKFVGTVATKNPDLIEHQLDERDLNLIKSKAGICYRDENLKLDNQTIIKNRELEVTESDLDSSTQTLKGLKNA